MLTGFRLGKNGAVALLLTLFMAVTSCASAELIAVSSILTFDVYKTYIKPNASPENLIRMAHVNVAVFGLVMAVFAIIWNSIGIDLGWLFLVMGLLIGGAVFPVAFAITWKRQSRAGAISGALSGLAAGLTAWLVEAQVYYGELTIKSTGSNYPTLAGNLAAILTGLIVSVVVSFIKPDDFDWEATRAINAEHSDLNGETAPQHGATKVNVKGVGSEAQSPESTTPEKQPGTPDGEDVPSPIQPGEMRRMSLDEDLEDHPRHLRSAFKLACFASFILTFVVDFLVPIPMFLSHYIFSQGFFTAWVRCSSQNISRKVSRLDQVGNESQGVPELGTAWEHSTLPKGPKLLFTYHVFRLSIQIC